MTATPTYVEPFTGTTYPLREPRWCGADGSPLLVSDLPGIKRDDIKTRERSIWRYAKALPIPIASPISLGEGCTPLLQSAIDNLPCKLKLEWFAPTGSFKDRGSSVMLSQLKQQGITTIIEDSSGNGGASIAAYGAAAGMKVKVFVPESTQAAKVAQVRAYGAEVILVPGPREATEAAAIEMSSKYFYASHNWQPFFLQGTKTLGYEIWEDLGFRVPDNIIIPASAGSNLLGCYTAFTELIRSGEIDRLPKLFISQPANCAPLHASFQVGADDFVATKYSTTIAEGTAIKRPVRLKEMLHALRDSNGGTVAIDEAEIISTALKLARQGLYVEPTCAHAAAGFTQLVEQGLIEEQQETVIILTGTGLKATSFYAAR